MTDSTSAGSSKNGVSESTLKAWQADAANMIESGVATSMIAVCPIALSALCREVMESRSSETPAALSLNSEGHISEMTVRRIDTSYVVTWLQDGEPCGSETISEKLALALIRNSEGISANIPAEKAAAPRDPLLDGLCDHGLRIEDCERGCKKAYDMLPSEADNPTHQHAAGCPKLWGYECECTPEPLSTPSNGN